MVKSQVWPMPKSPANFLPLSFPVFALHTSYSTPLRFFVSKPPRRMTTKSLRGGASGTTNAGPGRTGGPSTTNTP
eukprot:3980363-Pyramimonas_sp.AAC.1